MAKPIRSLRGKVAVVTGAARGVGRATALALAGEGLKVALLDLDGELVEKATAECGFDALGLPLDITDHDAFRAALDAVEARFGPIDILINNAGIMPVGPFEDEPDATARAILEVNLHAPLWSTKDVLRRLRARGGGGHIVNVASGAAWIAGGGGGTYSASKAGVLSFSHALSLELHGSSIDVSVVAPAVVKTELSSGLADVRGLRKVGPEDVAAAIVAGLKRPRFVIWVPREMGVMALMTSALPYRIRDGLARAIKADRLLLQVDAKARAAYDARLSDASRADGGRGPR